MRSGSAAAIGLNCALLAVKLLFALYGTAVLPFATGLRLLTEVLCGWLEAAVAACIVALQFYPGSGTLQVG